jgi:hypothetical protein
MSDISPAAIKILRELAVAPQVIGYDYCIKELDEAQPRLVEWLSGHGYIASAAGHALLERLETSS